MAILRTIICDVCGKAETESTPNAGWDGWGSLQGIELDGVPNPILCPAHLVRVADRVDEMKKQFEEG